MTISTSKKVVIKADYCENKEFVGASIIVAHDEDFNIGRDNKIPWRLKDDLAYFKAITQHHVLIMGRHTFDSLPCVLPDRIHIVVSTTMAPHEHARVHVVRTPLDAQLLAMRLALIRGQLDYFVIGGPRLYTHFESIAKRLHITMVHSKTIQADAKYTPFTQVSESKFNKSHARSIRKDENNHHNATIDVYTRKFWKSIHRK